MRYDLHRHLEGSHSPRALLDVAQRFDVKAPVFFAGGRFSTEAELAQAMVLQHPSDDATIFYACIVLARAAYVSVDAIAELARIAFREAADETDGLEMRVSLFSMTRTLLENEGVAWRALAPVPFAERARSVLVALLASRDAVEHATAKRVLVRLGFSRTFESEPHYRALAEVVLEHAPSLVGLDVLGIVTGNDPEPMPAPLVAILERLRPALPDLTIHAGEFDGAASVERTLALSPRGIGHGVRSLENPSVLERLAREGVTLEVCPTSNRLLIPTALGKLEHAHGAMPLVALQRAHVHCVLGSDDPAPMGTSFPNELAIATAAGVDLARLDADMKRRWTQLTRDVSGLVA
ncbi:MAG: hypothetical protein ABI321_07395 [Polyangia bacterium]